MAGSLRTQLFALLLLTGGGVALACGGDGGDDGGTPPNTTAIAKASSSGDAQTGTVGQELTALLQVVVTDGGAPSAGKTVTWATASGGSLDPTSAVTDASGIASTTWTLGTTAGAQTATATLSGASGSPVTFNATADPDAPAALSKAGGDQQNASLNGPLPLPVQAKVADQFGNGVPDVAVGWTATGGTVSAPSVPSDAVGISSVTVTAGGTAGPITIVATAENLTGSPQTFTATASETPPTPTTAAVSVANNSFTPASLTIAAGTTVVWTWQASAMSHTVTPVASEPSGSGPPADAPKTYQYKFSNPGTFVYYCTVHGSPTAGMRGTIIVQ